MADRKVCKDFWHAPFYKFLANSESRRSQFSTTVPCKFYKDFPSYLSVFSPTVGKYGPE